MTNPNIPRIQLLDIHKSFGHAHVLQGISLKIQPGESWAIIGSSGTGKSVTLKCIIGLMVPTMGDIRVDGESIIGQSAKARQQYMKRVGMLFQGAALFDSLSIWENIAFTILAEKRATREQARQHVMDLLPSVGLTAGVADYLPADLSGGMQKRAGLARAIITRPDILFFDEPTTGLDPIAGDIINSLISKQVKNLGATAVTITHDMNSARLIADHVVLLHAGKAVWKGAVTDLDLTENAYVKQFIHGSLDGPIKILSNPPAYHARAET